MKINPAIAQANLTTLQHEHPHCANGLLAYLQRQREARQRSRFELRMGANNLPTLVSHTNDSLIDLHAVASAPQIKQQLESCNSDGPVIVAGLGVGFVLLAAQQQKHSPRLMIIEPEWDIVFEALRWFDAAPMLRTSNVILLCGEQAIDQLEMFLINHPVFDPALMPIIHGRDPIPGEDDIASRLRKVPREDGNVSTVFIAGNSHKELLTTLKSESIASAIVPASYERAKGVSRFLRGTEGVDSICAHQPQSVLSFSAFALEPHEWQELGSRSIKRRLWFYDDPQRTLQKTTIEGSVDEIFCFDPTHTERLKQRTSLPVHTLYAAASYDENTAGIQPGWINETPVVCFVGSTGLQRYPEAMLRAIWETDVMHPFEQLVEETIASGACVPFDAVESLPIPDALTADAYPLRQDLTTFCLRRSFLLAATELPLTVIGDAGWRNLNWVGSLTQFTTGQPIDFVHETPWVYKHSAINLNLFNVQCINSPTIRMIDVMMMGGFLLTEHRPFIEEMFHIGAELDTFRTPQEMVEKCRYYLDHPEERARIASAGKQRVLAEHRYRHRLAQIGF